MGLLKDAAYFAAGYGAAELLRAKGKKKAVKQKQTGYLDDLINGYARQHDIFGYNNRFYKRIMKIAEKYREYVEESV
ncbi:MAG: hypothetical protein IKS82_01675 [Bacteroidales bacterium]|nr:hypothetical protein [Bacteroidales bacterium]